MLVDYKRRVVLNPKDAEARFEYGEALFLDGQSDAAAVELEKALDLDPSHGNARRMLARVCVAQGRATVAEKLLRPAADAGDPAACEALADLYLQLRRADDALLYLDVALQADPKVLDRALKAAEIALVLRLVENAASYLGPVLVDNPTHPRVRNLAREIAQQKGDLVGSSESPLGRGPEFLLGRTRTTLAKLPDELASVRRALEQTDVVAAKRALLTTPSAVKTGALAHAFGWLKAEVALACGDLDLADRAYRELTPKLSDPKDRARSLCRIGEIATYRAEPAKARDAYVEAIAAHEDADALEGLGDALAVLGDASSAEDAYRRAAKHEPAGTAAAKLASLRAKRKHVAERPGNVGRIGALGWSANGGHVSSVEAVAMPGKGELTFTGNVGMLGREAAQVAFSLVKARAESFGIGSRVRELDMHLHFADMDVAKDGASAGLALTLALLSAYRDEELVPNLAATGEISVQGIVRPVAGLHEKLVAACLAGIRVVLLPRKNVLHIQDLPAEVRRRVSVHSVDSLPEAIEIAFGMPPSGGRP